MGWDALSELALGFGFGGRGEEGKGLGKRARGRANIRKGREAVDGSLVAILNVYCLLCTGIYR